MQIPELFDSAKANTSRAFQFLLWRIRSRRQLEGYLAEKYGVSSLTPIRWYAWHYGSRYFSGTRNSTGESFFLKTSGSPRLIENEVAAHSRFSQVPGAERWTPQLLLYNCEEPFPFIAFEFIRGRTLYQILQENAWRPAYAAIVPGLVELTDVLAEAQLVHRDIIPKNLLVEMDRAGNPLGLRLIDFALTAIDGRNKIDDEITAQMIENLGEGLNPGPLLWDDAFACLQVLNLIQEKTPTRFTDTRQQLQARIGRLRISAIQKRIPRTRETRVKRILILDRHSDPEQLTRDGMPRCDAVLCLFWASPETCRTLAEQTGGECYSLKDIIRDREKWEREAAELVRAVCSVGPEYSGLKWRSYLAERLFQEALDLQLAGETIAFVKNLVVGTSAQEILVEAAVGGQLEENLRLVLAQQADAFTLKKATLTGAPADEEPIRQSRRRRLWDRWNEIRITGNWRLHAWQLAAQLDARYRMRAFFQDLYPPPRVPPGGLTLFSSYGNNSRILAAIEPLLASPVAWVLMNESARTGIAAPSAPRYWLWQFSWRQQPPLQPKEEPEAQLFQDDPLRAAMLQAWLVSLPLWKSWVQVELPALAQLTRFWEGYLERAKPSGVLMASQWGLEGWLMAIARRRNIPVLQLLHGALGGYFYTQVPIQSDALFVWGDYWRELFPLSQRGKIAVFTPPTLFKRVTCRPAQVPRLVYFSWPLRSLSYYNPSALLDKMISVLRELLNEGIQVTVRAHPAENPGDFLSRWRQRYGEPPPLLRIDKHGDLSELLVETDIALMFRSTVMLDCLVNEIPIVMPGWVEPGGTEALSHISGVHLATDWQNLEAKLREWVWQPPAIDAQEVSSLVETNAGTARGLGTILHSQGLTKEAGWKALGE